MLFQPGNHDYAYSSTWSILLDGDITVEQNGNAQFIETA
jgi:hypothetical protein